MTNPNPQSHYVGPGVAQEVVSRTLSVIVDNEPGVLARVIGLFTARGYNIDSLTVTDPREHATNEWREHDADQRGEDEEDGP